MPKKFTPEKRDNGSYVSSGLSDKQFNQLFKKIQTAQKRNRRNAKRTLKPSTFTNPTSKALQALGEKAKGQRFTKDDLVAFDKARQRHKEKYNSKEAGITYAFLVASSREIDIKRANNRVDDGTGITRADFYALKNNLCLVNVKASVGSKHQNHRVEVRFEQWDELLQDPPNGDYNKAAQLACAGRISFDCSCGRHQYWYRYLATMGNYCVAPPKEFAFPKIKNPELSGVACKHVIKTVTMLQSPAWQRILANQMKQQAKRVGYGSDNRTHFLDKEERKAASKNRKTMTDQEAAKREFAKYVRSQEAMQRQLAKQKRTGDQAKRQARKIRKQSNKINELNSMLKMGFQNFNDGYKLQGKTRAEAVTDFAKMMNVSPSKLERIIK